MDQISQPGNEALESLSARVRHDLACLDYPARPWVRPHASPQGHVYDVLIIGGGQSGLAAAFGLMREKVGNILVVDENPAGQEGPWVTYARMVTLRTPKHLISVDLGVPSLTFRAWWEAQYGPEGWEALGKIPRGDWMRYLIWYRERLGIPVRNEAKAVLIEPLERELFRVRVEGVLLAGQIPGAEAERADRRSFIPEAGLFLHRENGGGGGAAAWAVQFQRCGAGEFGAFRLGAFGHEIRDAEAGLRCGLAAFRG